MPSTTGPGAGGRGGKAPPPRIETTLSGSETVAFAWAVLLAFLRSARARPCSSTRLTADEALGLIEEWPDQPYATVVHPTDRHSAVLRELLAPLGTAGNLTSDAHLAALAIEHGATLCSCDNDFSRFESLRWSDPLKDQGHSSLGGSRVRAAPISRLRSSSNSVGDRPDAGSDTFGSGP